MDSVSGNLPIFAETTDPDAERKETKVIITSITKPTYERLSTLEAFFMQFSHTVLDPALEAKTQKFLNAGSFPP